MDMSSGIFSDDTIPMNTETSQIVMNDMQQATDGLIVKIEQDVFQQAVSLVSRAISKNPIQPILNNLLLKTSTEKNALILASTDLNMALSVEIPATIVRDGQGTLPALKLQEIVSKLPKEELRIECNEQANFTLTCGRFKFDLRGMSAAQYPQEQVEVSHLNNTQCLSLSVAELKRGTDLVSFASDKRDPNSILNGICFEFGNDGLKIASTDGSRLAFFTMPQAQSANYKKAIVPFKTITELQKMISDLTGEVRISLSDESIIVFEAQERVLRSCLIEGSYPEYRQLIPSDFSQVAKISRQSFISSLERAAVFANNQSRIVKLFFETIGVLTISASTPDLGGAEDQVDLDAYDGYDFTIGFNVNYMLECLKTLDSDSIELKMSESLKPIIIQPLGDDEQNLNSEYIYLLMPMRIS